jgi:hypothetical protein
MVASRSPGNGGPAGWVERRRESLRGTQRAAHYAGPGGFGQLIHNGGAGRG